ncbi:glycosyltransferase [Lentzea sp. NPDC102401]|uniref:glycosyltransferase n=1 Tax=Lentzea sp. NPDC102401 TaxID=3364128 RepID=UPI0038279E54
MRTSPEEWARKLIVVGNVKGPLPDRVTVRTGLSEQDLAELLCSAEVACVPSLYEGFALPAIEAMACGTPLVVSDGGALPEVVGDCGVVVPAGNSSALAHALRTLLNDHQLRRELGDRGVIRTAGYTWHATAEATAQAYRLLLDDQRNGVTC